MTETADASPAPESRSPGTPSSAEPLTKEAIQDAVHLASPGLIKEVYDIALRQMQAEAQRQGILDGKAATLLGGVGLSLTLSLALTGQALSQNIARGHKVMLAIILLIGTISAVISAILAMRTVRIADYGAMKERTLFDKALLCAADEQTAPDGAVSMYRRYLMPQIWRVVQVDTALNERKATLVASGQRWFFVFVLCIASIGVVLGSRALTG